MEVLFVSHKYPPAIGGMEKQSFELIRNMGAHVTVHRLIYEGKGSRAAFLLTLRRKITRICREHPGISLVHFSDGLIGAVSLWHRSYGHPLKRVVTVHGLDVVFPNLVYQKWILPGFARFDRVIAVSQATADACRSAGIPGENIVVVPNGVDHQLAADEEKSASHRHLESKFALKLTGKRVIMMIGRPVKRKGFSWFISRVLPRLRGSVVLVMVGPMRPRAPFIDRLIGLLPTQLEKQVQLLFARPTDEADIRRLLIRYPNKAKHLGKVSHVDLVHLLAVADAMVMPNIRVKGDMEGFGLVCLEASLAGPLVFASRIDGIPDAIHHGQNGMLLPPENEELWAYTLNRFLADPDAFPVKKTEARAYTLANFSWKRMAEGYAEVFSTVEVNDGSILTDSQIPDS